MSRHLLLAATLAAVLAGPSPARPPASVFIEDFTTFELKDVLRRGRPVALIFNAGMEETGPHVALGKHLFRARAYAERIATGLGDTLVAPILPFAPNGADFDAFPGTVSLDERTFTDTNEQVARSMIRSGFKVVALLGDHGPGQRDLRDLALHLDAEFAPKGVRVFFISDGYGKARAEIEAAPLGPKTLFTGGHGGIWDTAETMAVRPAAVRTGRFPHGSYDPKSFALDAQGVSGDPHGATARLGRAYGALRVRYAIDELRRDLALPNPSPAVP